MSLSLVDRKTDYSSLSAVTASPRTPSVDPAYRDGATD